MYSVRISYYKIFLRIRFMNIPLPLYIHYWLRHCTLILYFLLQLIKFMNKNVDESMKDSFRMFYNLIFMRLNTLNFWRRIENFNNNNLWIVNMYQCINVTVHQYNDVVNDTFYIDSLLIFIIILPINSLKLITCIHRYIYVLFDIYVTNDEILDYIFRLIACDAHMSLWITCTNK